MIIRTASDRRPEPTVPGQSPAPGVWRGHLPAWICLVLFLLVGGVFSGAVGNGFVNYDDNDYVTANYHVQQGLCFDTLMWAFFSDEAANWHPLTWLSHAADCEVNGLNPGGPHLTNVFLHGLNTVLVFIVLFRLTGALWRSALVAALFGMHPSHVESVAWISERKDVLSTIFLLLTLVAYLKYTDEVRAGGMRRKRYYRIALALFVMGLMSKPMLVTVPFLLLLLDFWPLRRVGGASASSAAFESNKGAGSDLLPLLVGNERGENSPIDSRIEPVNQRKAPSTHFSSLAPSEGERGPFAPPVRGEGWIRLLIEKIPFFAASVLSCLVTYMVQKHGGAMRGLAGVSLATRAGNALVAYCRYLGELFFPTRLAVFYPYPAAGNWPAVRVIGAIAVVISITVVAITLRKRRSYLPVGWFWFLGTLVPVIGLVQVGFQSMADRYMYIPSIGLLVMLVWGIADLVEKSRVGRIAAVSVAAIGVLACSILTVRQVGYWKDGETLFRRVIAVTEPNCVPHYLLGDALFKQGRLDEAAAEFRAATKLKPNYADPHNDLGMILSQKGRPGDAIAEFETAIKAQSDNPTAHYNLGMALQSAGRLDDSIREFKEAIRLKPADADAHKNLGVALEAAGQRDQAMDELRRAAFLNPRDEATHRNLGILHGRKGEFDDAIREFQSAVAIDPKSVDAHNYLGIALRGGGMLDEAAAEFREALKLQPTSVPAHENLGDILERKGEFSLAAVQFDAAIRSSPQPAADHYRLGSVLRKMNQREDAAAHFREALRLRPEFPEAANELRALASPR